MRAQECFIVSIWICHQFPGLSNRHAFPTGNFDRFSGMCQILRDADGLANEDEQRVSRSRRVIATLRRDRRLCGEHMNFV